MILFRYYYITICIYAKFIINKEDIESDLYTKSSSSKIELKRKSRGWCPLQYIIYVYFMS